MRRHRPGAEYLDKFRSLPRLRLISPHFDDHCSPPPTVCPKSPKNQGCSSSLRPCSSQCPLQLESLGGSAPSPCPPGSPNSTPKSSAALFARASSTIAKPSPAKNAAPTKTATTGASPYPASAIPKPASSSSASPLELTAPTAPAVPSPATLPANSCIPFSTKPPSPLSPPPPAATTACNSKTCTSPQPSAALLPTTGPCRRSSPTARPIWTASCRD